MKLEKINCEVCGESNKDILEFHHITEQTDTNCSNENFNIAILCPTDHAKFHNNDIKIIGVFPSTRTQGRILVYINELGECNVPGMENSKPYYKSQAKSMKIRKINE